MVRSHEESAARDPHHVVVEHVCVADSRRRAGSSSLSRGFRHPPIGSSGLGPEHFVQSAFMSTTVQPFVAASSSPLSSRPIVRLPVIGPFAFRVGVMDVEAKARARAAASPLQHLEVAVGIAERRDRPAADVLLDADRLACLVVDEVDLRQLDENRLVRRGSRISACRCCRPPARAGCHRPVSLKTRMNSMPPPETMNVLKPLARR